MAADFAAWYEKRHGYAPFPWQKRLAAMIAVGAPPASIGVPTGAGKTAIIAAWFWARESGCPVATRLIYVVDRRLIVDSVTAYAEETLRCPVVKMRGGLTPDNIWLMRPDQPTLIVATVDQAGSRLLWRGYGVSARTAPIHAALIGNDVLLVLDEAHISTPFAATLDSVQQLRQENGLPWHVVTMSATQVENSAALELDKEDFAHPVLAKRLGAQKLARLVKTSKAELVKTMAREAQTLQELSPGVVGVICNTTGTARRVFSRLEDDKVLLTGRIRPIDKDAILAAYLPRMLSGSRAERQPLYVVATQTIEVGADLDFDALVSQNAPMDSLVQRFGRLDRLGELGLSQAVVVHEDLPAGEDCPIYGKTLLNKTWSWLQKTQSGKGKEKRVDFGILAMQRHLAAHPPPQRPQEDLPPLTADILRQLRQTEPPVEVDIAPWLHGSRSDDTSVAVVWREDLLQEPGLWAETVRAAPPVLAEAMPCPVSAVRAWLKNRFAVVADKLVPGPELRPGVLLVVPSSYGGYDAWGWAPDSREPVEDVGNQAGAAIRLIGTVNPDDVPARLAELGLEMSNPAKMQYPGGFVVRPRNQRTEGKAILLEKHWQGVTAQAALLTNHPDILTAARWHDQGKQDPRYQVYLGAHGQFLAKSAHPSRWVSAQAWAWSGLPEGWRHEIASVALLPEDASELLRYLVATHHGYGRSLLPIGGDVALWAKAGGPDWGNMSERLNEQYGPWGLAYLEAMLRLADWMQSREEQL